MGATPLTVQAPASVLDAVLGEVDEAALVRLARVADRVLAAPEGYRAGPWRSDRRAGAGQEFLDFQPHTQGGDVRRVDWRASARSRRVLERRYRDATSSEWCVCLDRSASMGEPGSARRRLSLQLAAALAYLLLHREHGVAFMLFGADVLARCPAGRGRAQLARVLRLLAEDASADSGAGSRLEACAGAVARRQSVVVVSDFLAEDGMRAGLARLLRRGGRVHALNVLDGAGLPAGVTGPGLLRDSESGELLAVPDVERAAAAAEIELSRQRAELEAFCRRHRVAYSECRVSERWQDALLRHLVRARRFDA